MWNYDDSLEEKVYRWAQKNKKPIYGILELTPFCNLNCEMCYVHLNPSAFSTFSASAASAASAACETCAEKGALRTASEWLSLAEKMKQSGVLFLLLTGGEPLLYPEFRRLYVELYRMGMVLTVNTNGTLIDKNWADFFQKYKPRRINISLYGSGSDTYQRLCHSADGFKKVLNGIHFLKENFVDVRLGCSLTRQNMHEYEQIISIGKQLELPVRIDTYMFPPAHDEKAFAFSEKTRMLPEDAARICINSFKKCIKNDIFQNSVRRALFLEQSVLEMHKIEEKDHFYAAAPRKMSCTAGQCSFAINWQGKMRPCVVMPQPEIDVFENGFEKSWDFLVKETDQIFLNLKCSTCELRSICRTCAACALLEGGAYDAIPQYMCDYSRHMLDYLKKISRDF